MIPQILENVSFSRDDIIGATIVYMWNPQPDITAYELAVCYGFISEVASEDRHPFDCKAGVVFERLPAEFKRHFLITVYDD